MKSILWIVMAGLLGAGCASGQSQPTGEAKGEDAAQSAVALEKKRQAAAKPTVKIGPDIIVEAEPELAWGYISKVEDWGSWMPKVTKVEPGAGLSPGALIRWQWDEKDVESTVVSVKEREDFSYQAAAASKKAKVKWFLKSLGPNRTLISLRAEVPYGTASEVMDKLGPEMSDWISALQTAIQKDLEKRRVEADAAKKAKGGKKK